MFKTLLCSIAFMSCEVADKKRFEGISLYFQYLSEQMNSNIQISIAEKRSQKIQVMKNDSVRFKKNH